MAVVPVWLMGWDLTTVTVRFQVADATGLLGNGSPASTLRSLHGVIDAIEYSGEDTEEEIAPLTSRYENSFAIATNDRIRLGEICANTITDGNFLAEAANNAQRLTGGVYALFNMVRSGNSIGFTGTMGELRESVRMGKSVMTLELAIADIFTDVPPAGVPAANPVFA